ncbi:alpha/beta fold hydrolase [Streptomyces sp. NPDC090306]|uniref:alpha/beta fold hydrolase n=1 Tax=Streptomyces sp. NPDC090306 TaxID=3365961 RepID=UPI00382D389F
MPRSSHPRKSTYRVLAALALLTLTVGAVTACGGNDNGDASDHASSASSASSTSTGAGRSDAAKLHMITNDGHRLAFYVIKGSERTIVLDSGGGEDASQWKHIAPELHADTGATVITYDRAGLGKSDVVPGPWKVKSAVSDLRSGLEQLGVTKNVTLVAHSQAGEIANNLAQDNPKMLSGAVLVDANLPGFFTDQEIPRLVAGTQPEVDAAKKNPDEPANRQLISTAEGFASAHKVFHTVVWPDSVPARVLVSEQTPFEGSPVDAQRWRDAAAAFAKAAPNRTLVTVKGSSHEIPTDRPALVIKEVERMVSAER